MSSAIKSLRVLHNNPFILAPIFPAFFQSLGEKRNGLLLSYLVLPMVLPPAPRKFLTNANSRSSLMTLAGKPEDRNRLFGLEERICEYRTLTNASMQHLVDNGMLSITKYLSAKTMPEASNEELCPLNTIKSASRLGLLFAPFDVPSIYRILGIKQL
jgi:hypothetical protein